MSSCTSELREEIDREGEHLDGGTHPYVVVLKDLFAGDVDLVREKLGAEAFDALRARVGETNARLEQERPAAFDGTSSRVPYADLAVCVACWRAEVVEIEESWSVWRTSKRSGLGTIDVVFVMGVLLRNLVPAGLPMVEVHDLSGQAVREIHRAAEAGLSERAEWARIRAILRDAGVDVTVH